MIKCPSCSTALTALEGDLLTLDCVSDGDRYSAKCEKCTAQFTVEIYLTPIYQAVYQKSPCFGDEVEKALKVAHNSPLRKDQRQEVKHLYERFVKELNWVFEDIKKLDTEYARKITEEAFGAQAEEQYHI